MAQDYYTILTNAGLAYEAQQKAQNKPITLTHYGICDGNGATYNPDPAMTALRREVTPRRPLNALLQDPNNPTWLVAEGLLPDDVGGWTIRALGIYTDTGVLYAVAKCPESVKPLLASGSGKQFYVRVIFQTSNAASVTLLVDNSVVMAPRSFVIDHVRDELAKRDHKQSVRVATVAPIILSGEQSIDGIAVVSGDRVLVKDQASTAANGVYVAAAGVWTRAADADSGAKLNPGATVTVESGMVNADTQWTLKTDGQVVVGTTPLVFQWVGGQNVPDRPEGDNGRSAANTAYVDRALATAGMPRFAPYLWPGLAAAMPEGDTQSSGQQLTDLMYPTMRADVTATQFTCTEAIWQADPYKRVTHWSLGDGASWMRPPDKNGVQPGNVGAFYGVGANPAGAKPGTAVADAMQGHHHTVVGRTTTTSGTTTDNYLYDGPGGNYGPRSSIKAGDAISDGVNGDPRISSETRPRTWYGIWMIRMYGRVTNAGDLNAPALNARMDLLDARVASLEGKDFGVSTQKWFTTTATRLRGVTYVADQTFLLRAEVNVDSTTSASTYVDFTVNGEVFKGATVPYGAGSLFVGEMLIAKGATFSYQLAGSFNASTLKVREFRHGA
ncbi:UNVERIFIED_ORG: hypothetical protein HNP28_003712 [Comamonas terrigena]